MLTSFNLVLALVGAAGRVLARRRPAGVRRGGGSFSRRLAACGVAAVVRAAGRAPAAFRLSVRRSSSRPRSASSRATTRATRRPSASGWRRALRRRARPCRREGFSPRRSAGSRSSSCRCRSPSSPLFALRGVSVRPPSHRRVRPALTAQRCAAPALRRTRRGALPARAAPRQGWGMSPAAAGLVVTVTAACRDRSCRASRRARLGLGVRMASGHRSSWRAASPASPSCHARAGSGRSRRSSSSAQGSASRLQRSPSEPLAGREQHVVHGGWTLAARHAGVVLGLLLLAPVLTSALEQADEAVRAGAAECSTAGSRRSTSCASRRTCSTRWRRREDRGELPDVSAVFEDRPDDDDYRASADGASGPARSRGHGCVLDARSCSRRRSRSARSSPLRSREESAL